MTAADHASVRRIVESLMGAKDIVLALFIVAVWGANFTVIKVGLADLPPLLLAALRYVVVAIPAVFFVRRPKMALRHLLAYGFTVGVVQFAALFYAMHLGMPAGLASVVMQAQAFFTAVLAYLFLGERMSRRHVAGIVVAGIGLTFIAIGQVTAEASLVGPAMAAGDLAAMERGGGGISIGLAGVLLTLVGAASWACSNIIVRLAMAAASERDETVDTLGLIVWSALVPPMPLFALALLLHGPGEVFGSLGGMTVPALFSVAYLAYGATLFGYRGWSELLSRYPAGTVGSFSLLVPVTGLLTAGVVLSEKLSVMQWLGSAGVVAGLLIVTLPNGAVRRGMGSRDPADGSVR